MEERKLTCIGCPMGCQLQVIIKDGIVEKVTGNTCKRGADYGKKEVTDPTQCHLDKDCFIVRNSYTADKHFVYLLYFYLITLLT